ncbi:hypothetical protein GUITHDRAFT_121936 [Guillardia theta CCMP2712]|uniref:Guanylate cyclase domain-containing protein n=1 Tax=Guillardia theta (strain CCMP2712) TaxID=905079 RepID=L1I746_GUITC|nr:hypothetical protein GUITHDRAFT_121936 [Guillardia theta CCMP2712]EKX31887.1 hypothetical protein GUITHDRAFT_121936 [Guillardia theta CCMP2712]|eukprot:XP_005818867.1 hypothetical protein GUITHDRAFT_121936 [Guillardia theta CCMP2712]
MRQRDQVFANHGIPLLCEEADELAFRLQYNRYHKKTIERIMLGLALPSFEPYVNRSRNKDILFTVWNTLAFMLEIARKTIADLRRSETPMMLSPHVNMTIDYLHGVPWTWSCSDSNPVDTAWKHHTVFSFEDAQCTSRLLTNESISVFLFVGFFIPLTAGIDGQSAAWLCVTEVLSYVLSGLCVGHELGSMVHVVVLLGTFTLANILICNSRISAARERFMREKGLKASTAQTLQLLCTMIPRSLHTKLKHEKQKLFVGNTMDHCTIMHLRISPAASEDVSRRPHDVFNLVDKVFSDFDSLVDAFGMFKHYHSEDVYVVACPRAACPFQAPVNHAAYVSISAKKMIILAQQLIERSKLYRSPSGEVLWAKVGIHVGEVAGAVIGHQRRFYSLFGSTIHDCRRLCDASEAGRILCSEQLVEILRKDVSTCLIYHRSEAGESQLGSAYFVEVDEENSLDLDPESLYSSSTSNIPRREEEHPMSLQTASSASNATTSSGNAMDAETSVSDASNSNTTWRIFLQEDQEEDLVEKSKRSREALHHVNSTWCEFADVATEASFLESRAMNVFTRTLIGIFCNSVVFLSSLHALKDLRILQVEEYRHVSWRISFMQFAGFSVQLMILLCGLVAYFSHLRFFHSGSVKTAASLHSCVVFWQRALVLCNFVFLAALVLCGIWINTTGSCLLFFPVFSASNLLQAGCQLKEHTIIMLITTGLTVVLIYCWIPGMSLVAIIFTYFVLYMSNRALKEFNWVEREQWSASQLISAENKAILHILNDLFPPDIAHEIVSTGRITTRLRRAVVLVLDISCFSQLTAQLTPLQAAELFHLLFSRLDSVASSFRAAFKVDSHNETYSCAAWAKPGEEQSMCKRMETMGRRMVAEVMEVAREKKVDLHATVGIAMGGCVAGAIGRLQQRYQLKGEAMEEARRLQACAGRNEVRMGEAVKKLVGENEM